MLSRDIVALIAAKIEQSQATNGYQHSATARRVNAKMEKLQSSLETLHRSLHIIATSDDAEKRDKALKKARRILVGDSEIRQ